MHLRNKQVIGILSFLLLATTPFLGNQAQPSPAAAQNNQRVEPTALPPDVDPNDPAIPVWARPAVSATPTKPAAVAANTPANQPGKTNQSPLSEQPIGVVTKDTGGQFIIRSQVNEVTLAATVHDARRRLITNLQKTDFVFLKTASSRT